MLDSKIVAVPADKVCAASATLYRPDVDTNGIDAAKLMRKIDIRLLPWLALLYLMNFLDRGSIGNAKVVFRLFRRIAVNVQLFYSYTIWSRIFISLIHNISSPLPFSFFPMLSLRYGMSLSVIRSFDCTPARE